MEQGSSPTTKTINYQFKILYCFGILFIVAGHCGEPGISLAYEWFPLYAFHVPLWMFCSGYFYNPLHESEPGKYVVHKAIRLLLPLYIWNLFYGLVTAILKTRGFTIGEPFSLSSLLIMPLTDGHQFAFNLGGWYIAPLIMIEISYLYLRRILSLFKIQNEYSLLIFSFALGVLGVYISPNAEKLGFWLVITRFMVLFPFYGLGYFYKLKLEKKDKLPNLSYFAIVFAVQLLLITKYGEPLTYLMAWCTNLRKATIITPYITAMTGIAFWLRVSRILTPILKESKAVLLIADNTFSIMIHHMAGFMVLKTIFAAAHRLFHLFPDFDMDAYKSSVWYSYCPVNGTYFSMVYIIFGICFSLAVTYMVQQAIRFIRVKLSIS